MMCVKKQRRRLTSRLFRLLPHLLLWLALVGYAALGALMFQHIEGGSESSTEKEYHCFLDQVIRSVQELSENGSPPGRIIEVVETHMTENFKSIWFQRPDRWTFFGSMFFCCTVFTTVGYGEIYPVTRGGKVACMFYAMVGIPLMLLVILDVGDFMARLMTRAYVRLHALVQQLRSCRCPPCGSQEKSCDSAHHVLEDGTYFFSHDVVVREPMDIRQVLQTQRDVRKKSERLHHNKEIFEKILARDHLLSKVPLMRSISCPELNRLPPPSKDMTLWDFSGLGDSMETLDVPFVVILFIVFAWILLGGLVLPVWEYELEGLDPFYFYFITLTTIGFGDIVPKHPKYFMITSFFIIIGMAIMTMAFKLGQNRIVSCYRQCIKFISRGNNEQDQQDQEDQQDQQDQKDQKDQQDQQDPQDDQ